MRAAPLMLVQKQQCSSNTGSETVLYSFKSTVLYSFRLVPSETKKPGESILISSRGSPLLRPIQAADECFASGILVTSILQRELRGLIGFLFTKNYLCNDIVM